MQRISLMKRLLFYGLLFGLYFAVMKGIELFAYALRESYGSFYFLIFLFYLLHYVFALVFLKNKKSFFKYIVSFVTAIISIGGICIVFKTGFFEVIDSDIWFYCVLFLPIVITWEIAYQILIRFINKNTSPQEPS